MKTGLINELTSIEEFLSRSSSCLDESDSSFAPVEGMLTIAQQLAHCAQTIDWFVSGMQREEGFDLDFESHWVEVKTVTSLNSARKWLSKSFLNAKEVVGAMSEEELSAALPQGPVMGGAPRFAVISGISDHTAHHRGALTVYSRLLGKTPTMPYMD